METILSLVLAGSALATFVLGSLVAWGLYGGDSTPPNPLVGLLSLAMFLAAVCALVGPRTRC